MPPHLCTSCHTSRAQILRPKTLTRLCAPCFTSTFESEILTTITTHTLFRPGERIAIGASGGKDSCVLASVLHTLNTRHKLGLQLVLLSVDEGITGYRDHSLDAVRRNAAALGLPLEVVSYRELYGWSMDEVVAQVGKKGNCTYCGVFRRQALDRGAARLGVRHVVTGHNADDVAETVVMNLLRGDVARLGRATSIVTSTPGEVMKRGDGGGGLGEQVDVVEVTDVKRSKPLMYAYEKEIVLYAHHNKLDYFSTECIYSPEAFRGSARTLIKNLERIRPESILDIVKSGVALAAMVPDRDGRCGGAGGGKCGSHTNTASKAAIVAEEEETAGGCNDAHGADGGASMIALEKKLEHEDAKEAAQTEMDMTDRSTNGSAPRSTDQHGQVREKEEVIATVPLRLKGSKSKSQQPTDEKKIGKCERCGYLSSQKICKACVLLESLNKARPKMPIAVEI